MNLLSQEISQWVNPRETLCIMYIYYKKNTIIIYFDMIKYKMPLSQQQIKNT